MIKPAALIMAVTMGAVSAGTYFGLDLLPPGLLPEPIGRAQKPESAKPGVDSVAGEQAAAAAPVQPAPAAAPAEQPVTEQDLAEEPPPPEPAAAPVVAQAQAEPEPAPEPEPVPAAPARKPEPYKPGPALADTPAPARAAAPKQRPPVTVVRKAGEDTPAPDSTQVASAEVPRQSKPKPPEADVIKPWWPDASQLPANQLKLQYAGQVQGEQAVALLFSAPLNLETLRQHAQIKTGTGQPVSGDWQLGKNPRLAVFRGLASGRYTVILSPQIADSKGFMLGQTLQGPVYIQPPPP